MSRRLEIELTSSGTDDHWTWRAAGAKEPKGVISKTLIPKGVVVGDVVRVEAAATLDGLEIIAVLPSRSAKARPETLPILGSDREPQLVTSHVSKRSLLGDPTKSRKKMRARQKTEARDTRGKESRPSPQAKAKSAKSSNRDKTSNQGKPSKRDPSKQSKPSNQQDPSKQDQESLRKPKRSASSSRRNRPQPKREGSSQGRNRGKFVPLKPGTKHRDEALAAMPEIQHKLAEECLKGGVEGVIKAIDRMNEKAKVDNIPQIPSQPLIALAEKMAPKLRLAEWLDRAEEAVKHLDSVDLREIRSVVVAAERIARDSASRDLAEKLREGLANRVEREHRLWLNEIAQLLADGRTVSALQLSSRPPKAGAPLPPDMSERLSDAASASLSADTAQHRWGVLLEAVAFSPVRAHVNPAGYPTKPNDELKSAVRRVSSKMPEIAVRFGIEAPPKENATKAVVPPPPPKLPA